MDTIFFGKMEDDKYIDINTYEKQEEIGEGAFGTVYLVRDKFTNEIYAAKISKEKLTSDDESQIRKTKQEINSIVQLKHPSILKFIGYSPNSFNGKLKPVIITEYCQNGSLKDIIELERQSKSPIIWDNTKKLINIFGIASAMKYLHSHNIIHRDLKPANILEDEFLFPKIADFGLSKNLHQNINSMTVNSTKGPKGTPKYISPEVFKTETYSKACDVYAFSLIVYEIMTLDEPFENLPIFILLLQICINKLRPKFNKPIPYCYKRLITKCWSSKPNRRPTFEQIVNELKTNEEFFKDINKEEYFNYIKYIENSDCSFDPSKKFSKITIPRPKYINEWKKYDKTLKNMAEINKRKQIIKSDNSAIFFDLNFENHKFDIRKFKNVQIRQRDDFEINPNIIGKGSFGITREAIDTINGQKVAFKELCLITNKNDEIQLSREIEILTRINHYSIQKLYGYIDENLIEFKSAVLLTIFEDNKSLEEFIQKQFSELDFTQKYIIMYGIALGLNHLHNKKIVHGNLNPKSILINEKMEPIITNFSYSQKAINNRISQTINLNEPIYIAPELFKMEDDNMVSLYHAKLFDVYNFSLLVYFIFTGEKPWNKIKQKMLLPSKIIEGERPILPSNFPSFLSLLIDACWDKNPNNRPSFSVILDIISDENFLSNLDQKIDMNRFKEYQDKVFQNDLTNYQIDVCINEVNFPKIPKDKYFPISNFKKICDEKDYRSFFNIYESKLRDDQSDTIFNIIKIKDKYSNDVDILELFSSLIQILLIDHPVLNKFYGCSNLPAKLNSEKVKSIYEYFPMYKNLPEIIISTEKNGNLLTNIFNLDITKKFIILYGIVLGMSYLHDNEIVHLNLCPENILLDENWYPIINIDITSRKQNIQLDIFTVLSEFSYHFVAPELFYENNIDLKKCDVYSFAMISYFLFTGLKPLNNNNDNNNNQTILMNARNGERPLIKGIISFPFIDLIEDCWNNDPSKRPSFNDILNKIGSPIFIKSISNIDFNKFQIYQNLVEKDHISILPLKTRTNNEFDVINIFLQSPYSISYLAKDKINDKLIIYEEILNSKCTFIERASLFANLNFTSIIKPIGLIKPDNFSNKNGVILLPYASKRNLEFLIEQNFLNYTQKCIIFYGIAFGMLKLHDQGISHNNLNSQNILINNDFEPWISGFIIPKSKNDENQNFSNDVFSFGDLSYYLFTGDKINHDITEKPKFPKEMEQSIINLISKCWESNLQMKLTFKQICEIISDYKFFVNSNYSFDIIKFYDYQIKIGELSFIKYNNKQITELRKISNRRINRKGVFITQEKFHSLSNFCDVLNYFKNNKEESNKYIIPADISNDLFKCGSFNSLDFEEIINKYEKIIIEVNYPSNSFNDLISILFKKNSNRIQLKIVISNVLHILCLPEIHFQFFSILINDSVISIGPCAFKGCKSLKKIEISSSVSKIGFSAFEGCSSLKKIVIPFSIIKIGANAFKNCSSLKKILIPLSIEKSFSPNYCGIDDKTEIIIYDDQK